MCREAVSVIFRRGHHREHRRRLEGAWTGAAKEIVGEARGVTDRCNEVRCGPAAKNAIDVVHVGTRKDGGVAAIVVRAVEAVDGRPVDGCAVDSKAGTVEPAARSWQRVERCELIVLIPTRSLRELSEEQAEEDEIRRRVAISAAGRLVELASSDPTDIEQLGGAPLFTRLRVDHRPEGVRRVRAPRACGIIVRHARLHAREMARRDELRVVSEEHTHRADAEGVELRVN
mmetsp:Transcript_13918/g.44648  ORF Transcript_13918/g.44648 Transcript_13918/m.44648 type:complete len:230 (-) Transcript_13918:310-999(-)